MFAFIKALFGFGKGKQAAPEATQTPINWAEAGKGCYQNPYDRGQSTLARTELIDTLDENPVDFIINQGWGLDPMLVDHSNFNPNIDQMTQGELIDLAGADSVRFVDLLIDFGWV